MTGNCAQWRELVAKYFPENQVNNALNVMKGESGCRSGAVGDTAPKYISYEGKTKRGYSVGLMQIRLLKGRPSEAHLLDPENNIKYAAEMYKARNSWCPWSAAHKIGLSKPCR